MKFPWKANEGETLIFFYGEDIVHVVFRLLYVEYSSMNYNYCALSCYLINIISHYFSCKTCTGWAKFSGTTLRFWLVLDKHVDAPDIVVYTTHNMT